MSKDQSRYCLSFLARRVPPLFIVCLLCFALSILGNSCSKDRATLSRDWSARNSMPVQEIQLKGLELRTRDINGDGIDDQLFYYRDGQLVYVERDIDFDGRIDLREYYEEGVHVRDEIDIDYDGYCDLIVLYKGGEVEKRYYSVDFQGTRRGVQIFDASGHRIELRRDMTGDGFLDTIEVFHPGSELPHTTKKYREGEDGPYHVEKAEGVGVAMGSAVDAEQSISEAAAAGPSKALVKESEEAPQVKDVEGVE